MKKYGVKTFWEWHLTLGVEYSLDLCSSYWEEYPRLSPSNKRKKVIDHNIKIKQWKNE